jgi:hypothetical protein
MAIEGTPSVGPARRLRLGMVGGGQGAFIGAVHRIAARLDDCYELVAGALSADPARAHASAAELHIAPDRALVRRLFAELRATGACTLTPDMALAVLRAYGMAVREPGPGFAVHHHELFIAVAEDAIFGPIIRFGQGGAGFDILGDIAVDLPPLNLSLAHALIARTRVARALRKAEAAWNEAGIADALVRVSQWVVDFPEIAALDINPLFVNADRAVVGTAGLSLRPLGAAPGRLAGQSPIPPVRNVAAARAHSLPVRSPCRSRWR